MRLVSVLAAVSAAGCLSTPPEAGGRDAPDAPTIDAEAEIDAPAGCVDEDGDHWPAGGAQCGRFLDCVDGDDRVFPGARENTAGLDLDCLPGLIAGGADVPDLQRAPMGTGWRITTRNAILIFHPQAAHQLSSLEIGSNPSSGELLFTAAGQDERWSGTNVWQGFFSTQGTGTPELTPGHAVLQWRVPFTHGDLSGETLYTISIDGRVQRSDRFTVSGQPLMPLESASQRSVTSYLALDAAAFADVAWYGARVAGQEVDIDQTAPFRMYFEGLLAAAPTWLCARTPLHDLVWAHGPGTTGPGLNARPRITSSNEFGPQLALQYDWTFSQPTVAEGAHAGNFLIVPSFRSAGSNLCGYAAQTARSYYEPARLDLEGTAALVIDDPGDANLDGYVEVGAYYLIDARGAAGLAFTVNTTGGRAAPPASTLRIRNLSTDPLPVIVRTPMGGPSDPLVHGRDYRIQIDGTGLWLVITTDLLPGMRIELVRAYQP